MMGARCLLELNAIQNKILEYFQQAFPGVLGRGRWKYLVGYRYYGDPFYFI